MELVDQKYKIDEDGVIHLKNPIPFRYDVTYVQDRYDSYGWKGTAMSYLRLLFIQKNIKLLGKTVLDIGYGNGEFLKICRMNGMLARGFDVSGYPLPEGVKFVKDIHEDSYDLITFFDSLEHFETLDFVKTLKANYICVSVPWCHYPLEKDNEWFQNWKHLRPEEHFHHFTNQSLQKFMKRNGYSCIDFNNIEDHIRGVGADGSPNILTALFKKDAQDDSI